MQLGWQFAIELKQRVILKQNGLPGILKNSGHRDLKKLRFKIILLPKTQVFKYQKKSLFLNRIENG